MDIMSIDEIVTLLRAQADMRALENDEAGILEKLADQLKHEVEDL